MSRRYCQLAGSEPPAISHDAAGRSCISPRRTSIGPNRFAAPHELAPDARQNGRTNRRYRRGKLSRCKGPRPQAPLAISNAAIEFGSPTEVPPARATIAATMASEYAPPDACRCSVLSHGHRIRSPPLCEFSRDSATPLRRCFAALKGRPNTQHQMSQCLISAAPVCCHAASPRSG